jgi:hypothetical protein
MVELLLNRLSNKLVWVLVDYILEVLASLQDV